MSEIFHRKSGMNILLMLGDSESIFLIATNKQNIFIDFRWLGLNFVFMISLSVL